MEVFKIIKIIGSSKKKINLIVEKRMQIRPTLGRIRENLFNILQKKIPNSIGLDLFSGTGSIGIEALSKGAYKIFFIDNNKKVLTNIKKNLKKINFLKKSYLFQGSWIEFLNKNNKTFDWIYVDPPYNLSIYENIIKTISIKKCLKKNGLLIIETNKKQNIKKFLYNFFCFKFYKYGNTILWFYKEI